MKPIGSLNLIREINTSVILDVLKDNAPMSKYDISKQTGLSAPAVANIVNDLKNIGIVKETGTGKSIGGRPPLLLDLNLEGGFVIGTDVGIDNITSIVVDFLGNTVAMSVVPVKNKDTEFVIFDKIIKAISDSINKSGKDPSLFMGIGIGISGVIDTEKGIVNYATRLKWKNVPLKSIIENSFGIPGFIDENVRLLTFAEKWLGAGKNYKNLVCIRVGDDIGAGIIINEKLYNGSNGKAGMNISHMTVKPEGIKCECGKTGCLQTVISGRAILQRARTLMSQGHKTLLCEYSGNNINNLTVALIDRAASEGDRLCLDLMEETAKYLAIGISNIKCCLEPEIVIIGGGIGQSQILFDFLKKYMNKYVGQPLKVSKAMLGENGFAIGAAAVVIHNIFSYPGKFYKNY